MAREKILLRRTRWALAFLIAGLVVSGLTAIPLDREVSIAADLWGASDGATDGVGSWLVRVRDGLRDTNARYPFMAYGTDWLAFAHVVIAIAFIGPWRDPVRNVWVVHFGIIACVLVVPTAMIMGPIRGIPIAWRLLDCMFGAIGVIPLLLCRTWIRELSAATEGARAAEEAPA